MPDQPEFYRVTVNAVRKLMPEDVTFRPEENGSPCKYVVKAKVYERIKDICATAEATRGPVVR